VVLLWRGIFLEKHRGDFYYREFDALMWERKYFLKFNLSKNVKKILQS
jgi:hypothetical protein